MGKIDMIRQYFNVYRMKMLYAKVVTVIYGNKTLKDAVNESLRYWINNPDSYYLIGSIVGPHPYPKIVAKFQSIISKEIREQFKKLVGTILPNYIIACVGGGSNAIGAFYNFLYEDSVKLIAVEAAGLGIDTNYTACSTYKGTKGVIHGSITLLMHNQYGQITDPYSISAGLDYPGIGPMLSQLYQCKRINFLYVTDTEALYAAYELIRFEGIIPALESAHALAGIRQIHFKNDDIFIINISGKGDKDINLYSNFYHNV
jgi:tryptophan synthase beta chain